MTKAEARQRIRNLKSSILNSTEIFAEALALRIADDMNFSNIQTEYFYGGKRKYKTIK